MYIIKIYHGKFFKNNISFNNIHNYNSVANYRFCKVGLTYRQNKHNIYITFKKTSDFARKSREKIHACSRGTRTIIGYIHVVQSRSQNNGIDMSAVGGFGREFAVRAPKKRVDNSYRMK
jgi:hypothetical protein